MEKNSYKVMAVVALTIAVLALAVGFASFSTTLSIQNASLDVQPYDAFTPNVQFVQGTNGNPSVVCENRNHDAESSFVLSKGSLNDNVHATIWSNASFVLNGPGDYIWCSIEFENRSPYIAYLNQVSFSRTLSCSPVAGTVNNLNAACAELKFSVILPNENAYATSTAVHNVNSISGVSVASDSTSSLALQLSYGTVENASTAARADGDFIVELPDITIYGSTQD